MDKVQITTDCSVLTNSVFVALCAYFDESMDCIEGYKSISSRPRKIPTRISLLQFAEKGICRPARARSDSDHAKQTRKKGYSVNMLFYGSAMRGLLGHRRVDPQTEDAQLSNLTSIPTNEFKFKQ